MDFINPKLPLSAAPDMRLCPIDTVKPFGLMLAPMYVFLKRNERFVAVKAPMDFFVPDELERLKPYEAFFLPKSIDSIQPFREAARRVRALLSWEPTVEKEPQAGLLPPYVLSDAVLRVIGPLWSAPARIESYFVSVFVNELCELLPGDKLREARDGSVELFERAIFRSSLAVFLALHLGYMDLAFLNRLRETTFLEVASGVNHWGSADESAGEISELLAVVALYMTGPATRVVDGITLGRLEGRLAQKLETRIERVSRELADARGPAPTVFGPEGILVA